MSRSGYARQSTAFTLIEVLVVITVLALLAVLILPAVQMARSAARKTHCANNMRQLGIALQSYIGEHNSFPSGSCSNMSVFVPLLPYLELAELYDDLNYRFEPRSHPNHTVSQTRVQTLLCPEDLRDYTRSNAWTNYAGCSGRGREWYGYDGIFENDFQYWVDSSHITDGMTHTAAFAEWIVGMPQSGRPEGMKLWIPTELPFQLPLLPDFVDTCRATKLIPPPGPGPKGREWIFGHYGFTLYNHVLGPNENSCTLSGRLFSAALTAGSRHPGSGAHVVFADGSVRFVAEGIDLQTWRSFATRAEGDL